MMTKSNLSNKINFKIQKENLPIYYDFSFLINILLSFISLHIKKNKAFGNIVTNGW